jgi:hypothetical protein
MLQAAASGALFTVRVELVFERKTSCKSEFSSWQKSYFFPIAQLS